MFWQEFDNSVSMREKNENYFQISVNICICVVSPLRMKKGNVKSFQEKNKVTVKSIWPEKKKNSLFFYEKKICKIITKGF